MDFVGGYTTFAGAYRTRGNDAAVEKEIGVNLKNAVSQPGGWKAFMYMQGETIPKETNQVRLSPTEKDQWGIPLLITNVGYDDNDEKMVQDFLTEGKAMLEKAGCVKCMATTTSKRRAWTFTKWEAYVWGGIRKLLC